MTLGLGNTIGEIQHHPLVSVSQDATLTEAARTLKDAHVSCALLAEPPLRILTERDLAQAWAHRHQGDTLVGTIATASPVWAAVDTSIAVGTAMMIEHGVRHLVILDRHDAPCGIVSMRDLFVVLVDSHEPATVFASFATVLLQQSHLDER
jgi:predicted transcriptional regulator